MPDMTPLQTTPSSTDASRRGFESVQPGEYGPAVRDEFLTTDRTDEWRRLFGLGTQARAQLDLLWGVSVWAPQQHSIFEFIFQVLQREESPQGITWNEALVPSDLRAAMCDLDDAVNEAREDDFPEPSQRALKIAKRLLRDLYRLHPCRLETYPTPDGEIALVVPGGFGRSVVLLCDSDGGVLCLVNLNGEHRRARYSNATMLPDGFVREALEALAQANRSR